MTDKPKHLTKGTDAGTPELAVREVVKIEWSSAQTNKTRVRVLSELEQWFSSGFLDKQHIEAASKFREDFESCPFSPAYSMMNADAIIVDGWTHPGAEYGDSELSAWDRVSAALNDVGDKYSSAIWHVVGSGSPVQDWVLGYQRHRIALSAARKHVREALDRLIKHYRI